MVVFRHFADLREPPFNAFGEISITFVVSAHKLHMWNDLIGQLGKAIEDTFDDTTEEISQGNETFRKTPAPAKQHGKAHTLRLDELLSSTNLQRAEHENDSTTGDLQEVRETSVQETLNPVGNNSLANDVTTTFSTLLESMAGMQDSGDLISSPQEKHTECSGNLANENSSTSKGVNSRIIDNIDEDNVEHTSDSCPQEPNYQPPLQSREEKALLKFQQQLSDEMNENDRLRADISKLQAELVHNRSLLNEALKENTVVKDVPLLIDKLEREREKTKSLTGDLEEKQEQIDQLQYELQEYVGENSSLRNTIQQLEEASQAAERKIDELDAVSERKSAQLGSLQTRINEVKEENENLVIELRKLKAEKGANDITANLKLAEENDHLKAENERLTGELQSSVTEYESRLHHLDNLIFEANCRANDAESRLEEIERNNAYSLQNVRTDVDSMQTLLSQTSAMKSALETKCEELRKENATLKLHKHSVDKKLEDIILAQKTEIKNLNSKNASLGTELTQLQNELSELRSKLKDKEKEVEEWKQKQWNHLSLQQGDQSNSETSRSNVEEGVPPPRMKVVLPPWTAPVFPVIPPQNEYGEKSRLENEVVRQAMVIKELKREVTEYQHINDQFADLQRKHDVLLQMYGEATERMASLEKRGSP